MKRHPQVSNINEVESINISHGSKFSAIRKRLGAASGARELGCSWYEVPPGKQAFPHHAHFGNEEAFFILSGEGVCRIGSETIRVFTGDFISFPRGQEHAHSITNTGNTPLRYIGFSTANDTDIVLYPESQKIGILGGSNTQEGMLKARFVKIVKDQPSVDYYLDEE